MANFSSRNVLIYVFPAVIALLSVFWFKKKKRIKPEVQSSKNEAILEEKCEKMPETPDCILDESVECASDFANTLSDASSLTSPENSEKSLRTKNMCNNLPDDIVNNISSNNSSLFNHVESIIQEKSSFMSDTMLSNMGSLNVSDKITIHNRDNCEDIDDSTVPDAFVDCDISVQSKVTDIYCPEQIEEKQATVENTQKTEERNLNYDSNCIEENCNVKSSCNEMECSEMTEVFTPYSKLNSRDIRCSVMENRSDRHIIQSNPIVAGSANNCTNLGQITELEKLHITETDSNDSHSSVLDENSFLSCISDDNLESRQLLEFKNKDSPSSVLDENSIISSICDESEKSSIGEDFSLYFKSDELRKDITDFENIDKKVHVSLSSAVDKCCESVPVKHSNYTAFTYETEMPEIMENENSSPVSLFSASITKEFKLSECSLNETSGDSLPDKLHQNNSSELTSVTNSSPKLTLSNLNSNEDDEPLQFCKKSDSLCDSLTLDQNSVPLPNETVSSEIDILTPKEVVSKDFVSALLENIVHSTEKESNQADLSDNVDEYDHDFNQKTSTEDPQIAEMNISECISSAATLSVTSSSDSSLWKVQDNEFETLDRFKVGETEVIDDSKAPGSSSGHFVYEFELPQDLCGRLIGRQGKNVKSIKDRTNANVFIKRHPYDPQLKIVVVEGRRSDVNDALEIIRRKYPPSQFPAVTLVQTNLISSHNMTLPESSQLHLPGGVSCDVILSSLLSAGHFFLQQPTHPTYPSLSTLDQCMISCYSQVDTPLLPHPVEPGVICAAPVCRGWYRAQVIYVFENATECEIKFLDYGGFSQVSTSTLRQIRSDFMTLPFQASECYLANVRPVDRSKGWSDEATATFEELAQGQILQALLVEFAEDGLPCVHLYKVQGISHMFINKELVERGLAVWVNNHWDPH